MAAVTVVGYLVPAGGRIVAPHDCYGGTYRLFDAWRRRGERQVEFVDFGDEAAVRAALAQPPRCCGLRRRAIRSCASLTSPPSQPWQSRRRTDRRGQHFCPPPGSNAALGADLVVHSTTKYLNGHSDVVGGAVVARDKALHEQLAWWANCWADRAPFDSYMTLRACAPCTRASITTDVTRTRSLTGCRARRT